MPELPQLPTDNLYKFIAVGGLSLIILSFLGLGWILYSHGNLVNTAKRTQTKAGLLLIKRDQDLNDFRALPISSNSAQTSTYFTQLSDRVDVSQREYISAVAESNGTALQYEAFMRLFWIYLILCVLWGFLGILLMPFGLVAWYTNLQQFEDAVLRRKVDKSKIELEPVIRFTLRLPWKQEK